MRLVFTLCLTLLCSTTLTVAGVPEWLSPDASTSNRGNPKLVKGLDGRLLLTHTVDDGDGSASIYVSASTNDGLEWTDHGSPGRVTVNSLGLQRQPTTVGTSDGVLHAAWEVFLPLVSRVAIVHTFSTDNGATWSAAKQVYVDPLGGSQTFSSIAVSGSGQVFVTYLSRDAITDNNRVMLVSSNDNGTTWSGPTRVDRFPEGGACDCCVQNIAISADGEIAVSFRSNINNRRDIWVSRSQDNAETFSDPILVQDQVWTIFGCPSSGPTIEYDAQGDLHFSWRDERDAAGKSIVYYARLNKNESMTSPNVALSKFADVGEYSDVSVDPTGTLVQVIYETSDGLFASQSIDGGMSFRSTTSVDPDRGQGASAHAVWTPTQGHVSTWQTPRGENLDIRLRNDIPSSVQADDVFEARVWSVSGNLKIHTPRTASLVVQFSDIRGRQLGLVRTTLPSQQHVIALPKQNGSMVTLITTTDGILVWRGIVQR